MDALIAKIKGWLKNVVGDAVSSKKTLVAIAAAVLIAPKFAFVVWMVCQTVIDAVRIYKGGKA